MIRWGNAPIREPNAGTQDALPVRSEVRLRMKSRPATHGMDGAWWPRSLDPGAEFPELVLVLSSWIGPVYKVTYHVDDWDAAGSELTTDGWPVDLAASTTMQPNTVSVAGTHQRRRSLLVIPPFVPGGIARAVLLSAAGPDELTSAREMLTSNGVRLGLRGVD